MDVLVIGVDLDFCQLLLTGERGCCRDYAQQFPSAKTPELRWLVSQINQ